MLRNILNLPLLAFADFNIDSKDMINSGLLEAHGLKIKELPGGASTRFGSRKIDYLLYTGHLDKAIAKLKRDCCVPFAPHFAYELKLKGSDFVVGTRLKVPLALPLTAFKEKYAELDVSAKAQLDCKAENIAMQILQKQKDKTGYAILGQPPVELVIDKKIKGKVIGQAKVTGES